MSDDTVTLRHCSLYGKLPSKRDFVVVGAARDFLNAWEPWLQAAVSSSRNELAGNWQAAFLTAPIWRFWLGSEVCGRSVIGAFMSSLDGVGRYFPLTLFAYADDNAGIPPPELDPQTDWFDAAETVLMSALDQNTDFETLSARVNALPAPQQSPSRREMLDCAAHRDVNGGGSADHNNFGKLFAALRSRDHDKVYASSTFWWTIGGQDYPPRALCSKRLPDPAVFSTMLTGEFASPL
jgi:type VI secretion system protein ImpM